MIELIKKPNIDFMGKRFIAFGLSAVLSILGIIAIVQVSRGSANLGIDFAGGTAVQVKFSDKVGLDEIRAALEKAGLRDFDLQDLPSVNKILIRVKKKEEDLGVFSEKIISTLQENFTAKEPVIDSTTEIGPKVGKKLRDDAVIAIIAATIGLLIYVAFRFQFRFGVGATVAAFHDVLAVLGIFFLLGKEINLILVSALLMIAGYSLTDTVVVFDRIRENLKARVKESPMAVINSSINEVLTRTIIVSLTTLLAAISLFFFGGEVIHDFSLAIILGIMVGTYSSVFVASPIALLWSGKKLIAKKGS
jgi:preprotein translocase subunit SecF